MKLSKLSLNKIVLGLIVLTILIILVDKGYIYLGFMDFLGSFVDF